jgi:long-chain acyl-CoA synthetase
MSFYNDLSSHLSNIAIIQDGAGYITYNELEKTAYSISSQIEKKKALVFIFCLNTIESVAGYLGCLNAGHVPLLIDSAINENLTRSLLDTYKPNYIWAPSYLNMGIPKYKLGDYILSELYEEQHLINPELALLLTTSGSTGSPKLVRLSYKNLDANTRSIVQYLDLDETERPITTLPMNYTYGLSIINSHLAVGATILMTNATLIQKEFWDFFKKQNATSFGGVPYTYEILKKLRFFNMDLPSLKTMTQAGGKLLPELHREFAEFARKTGRRFIVMYGQTEATARMAYLPHEKAIEKYGSMGIAIPGGKFRLFDVDDNEIVEPNTTGELIYEGPNVSLGYAICGEDLAKGDENNGVLRTGDMAQMDVDGFFYIVGRKKRFLKLFGNRVNLDEIEQLLKARGYDCACTGTDDNLLVALTEKKAINEVETFLPSLLRIHKSAISVKYIPEIPKNEAGKTIYIKLLEELQ